MTKEQSALDSFFPNKSREKKEDSEKQEKKEEIMKSDKSKKKSQKENQNSTINTKKEKEINENNFERIEEEELDSFEEGEEDEEEEEIIHTEAPVEMCPQNTPPCCLLQSTYEGNQGKGFLYLLDEHENQLYGWYDNTNHKPYCLSDLSPEELQQISPVKNFKRIVDYKQIKLKNLLKDKKVNMTKILVTDPLAIGGRYDSLREKLPTAWEARIRYHYNYLYDLQLIPGMYYQIKEGNLEPAFPSINKEVEKEIKSIFKESPPETKELISQYLPLFLSRIPHIKRAAIDIEVYTKTMTHIADPNKAIEKIISVAIVGNDGLKKVLVLERDDVPRGQKPKELDDDVEIIFYSKEKKLLEELFKIMENYPMIITFNGDNFDLPYLYNRARRLKIPKKQCPIKVGRRSCEIKNAIHFDTYRFFNQAAIKIYAFGAKYKESSLDAISAALLNSRKVELEKEIGYCSCYNLALYNIHDSELTLKLTTFNNEITIKLIILLMRLTKMPFEDITRLAVSSWIRNWLFAEHRKRNYLIPQPEEIIESRGQSTTNAVIKGKKYKGAIVVQPKPGVHFNVIVLDFASLYPSIIKTWNLSYETMNCKHKECQINKKKIPDTEHWVCIKNRGLMSILLGFIRDIRVSWFKPKAKDNTIEKTTRSFYSVIQAALKVVINASYGVFGAPHFPLYCPPLAEATTAIGRQAITETIKKCSEIGVEVIYGDTDSVFLKNPTDNQIEELIQWSDEYLNIDLDVEKSYRYLALSERKKNYLGVYKNGNVDIKGLLGKKRNTPPFLKNIFNEIVAILSEVEAPQDFEAARDKIEELVQKGYKKLKNKAYSLEELAFKVQLNKRLSQYVKTTPQHVKAARMLKKETNSNVRSGDLISFVKTNTKEGVSPIELADVKYIDVDKYLAQMDSTLTQILDPIGISFDRIMGLRSLDDFFA
ncbi:MAG: DNA-directed DNA polymerase I [Asgard group archaeon]|nr:DNA-directed DNA polymerase I [Asgard group archaeon]